MHLVVQVLVPALQITKTAGPSTVVAGGAVDLHGHPGQHRRDRVRAGDVPRRPGRSRRWTYADYDGDATATAAYVGTVAYTDETLTWSGPLAWGETPTVTYPS